MNNASPSLFLLQCQGVAGSEENVSVAHIVGIPGVASLAFIASLLSLDIL